LNVESNVESSAIPRHALVSLLVRAEQAAAEARAARVHAAGS